MSRLAWVQGVLAMRRHEGEDQLGPVVTVAKETAVAELQIAAIEAALGVVTFGSSGI